VLSLLRWRQNEFSKPPFKHHAKKGGDLGLGIREKIQIDISKMSCGLRLLGSKGRKVGLNLSGTGFDEVDKE